MGLDRTLSGGDGLESKHDGELYIKVFLSILQQDYVHSEFDGGN